MSTRDGLPNLTRDEVLARLADAIGGDASAYAPLLQRSIWLRVDKETEPTPLGSRFGGPAMMPDGFEWPTYTAEPYMGRDPDEGPETFMLWYAKQQKLPMWLIAQLNLAELPMETPLPREGLLSIFYDPFDGPRGHNKSDSQGVRITYVPPEEFCRLRPHDRPEPEDHPGAFADWKWPHYRMEYFVKWSLSDWEAAGRLNREAADARPWDVDLDEIWETVHEIFGNMFGQFLLDGGDNHQSDPRRSAAHKLDDIQPPPRYEERGHQASREEDDAYETAIEQAAQEWTVLLSLTRDSDLEPMVTDTGGLSFLLRKSDLAQRRFDRPWIVRS